ncbi:MAG: cytochrome P450 [Erythrobacter sp.]|nr:cytochrome P450 [Erythrobacter sp.]
MQTLVEDILDDEAGSCTDDRRSEAPAASPCEHAVGDYGDARAILRDDTMRQAGFRADMIERFGDARFAPILFQHGERHRRQRAATARFFAPRVISNRYRASIEQEADLLIAELRNDGGGRLDQMSMRLAVSIAAEIVGLTKTDSQAMAARLDRFFATDVTSPANAAVDLFRFVQGQARLLRFFVADVRPAIRARRKVRQEDVISHLLDEGYSDRAILTECLTYAAAGMVTTREFITMAAWHLLDRPALADRFRDADEPERIAILEEILRLEPVVGTLRRRSENDSATVAIDIRAANGDSAAMGQCPHRLDPDRTRAERVGGPGLAFGDGPHRCPGASVAMLEAAIFLDRLLAVPGIALEKAPTMTWNPLVSGYELRGCVVRASA